MVQDAAYGTLLRARRRELHAAIARAIADLFPETAVARPELLAQHHEKAGSVEDAIGRWSDAGRRAIAASAMAEAAANLRRALELLPTLPDTPARRRRELDLQTGPGTALTATNGRRFERTGVHLYLPGRWRRDPGHASPSA